MMNIQYLEAPDKSENDSKEYKVLQLPNGLKVLLVSDPSPMPESNSSVADSSDDSSSVETSGGEEEFEDLIGSLSSEATSKYDSDDDEDDDDEDQGNEKLAACALMIDVGSFSDPRDIQGLAHFLEHMIFMGSEKYPEENAFDAHITKCGGFDNADTECEETNFYFEVPDEDLEESIERFISLLKCPLMKKEAMTRERNAIESEFQSTLQDDESRRDQLIANLGRPTHPCSLFTWGNLITLKDCIEDDKLHARLWEFQKRHYSSHRMYCAIQARLPMSELERIVTNHFCDIPNNNLPPIDFSTFTHKNAFSEDFFDNVYFIKPVSDIHKLELTWCLPSLLEKYLCKPHIYLAHIFGYEGSGSLCAYLRQKLWALDLVIGAGDSGFDSNSIYFLFTISIYLTEDGFDHLEEVLSLTFSYIKLFTTCKPHRAIFEELQMLEANKFRFQNEQSAFDNVQEFVLNLKLYPSKHILTGPELFFEYNENSILEIINFLNTEKFNISITSSKIYPGIEYNNTEKWFGTKYTSMKMPEKWLDLWRNAKLRSEFYFPESNKFIPTDFKIIHQENNSQTANYPRKIMESDIFELWYRQDDIFLLPEAYMYFYFMTPLPLQKNENAALLAVYTLFLKYCLVEELFPATIAGLYHHFETAEKGLILKINGYNEKMHLIVDSITKIMTTISSKITEKQLKTFLRQQRKNYNNMVIKPKTFNRDIRLEIVEQKHSPIYRKHNVINNIRLIDLKNFADNLFKEVRIQAIIQGNVNEETAHNIMNLIMTNLNCESIKDLSSINLQAYQIPLGSNYIIAKSLNKNDSNTVVCNYYQIGQSTLRLHCLLDLLLMFVEEPLFNILRTREQLGYDISSSIRHNCGILGYTITVNSQEDKFDCSYIDDRIEAFRLEMLGILQEYEIDEFDRVKESLIKTKQIVDYELKEEVSRNWCEITSQEYIFDRLKREVELIKTITKTDVLEFLRDVEFRKLSVQVVGNKNKSTESSESIASNTTDETCNKDNLILDLLHDGKVTITSIKCFQQNLYLYPVTRTLLEEPNIIQENSDKIIESPTINI